MQHNFKTMNMFNFPFTFLFDSFAADSDRYLIDEIDCTIPDDLTKVLPSENTQTSGNKEFVQFTICMILDITIPTNKLAKYDFVHPKIAYEVIYRIYNVV